MLRDLPNRQLVWIAVSALLGTTVLTLAGIGAATLGSDVGSGSLFASKKVSVGEAQHSLNYWTRDRMARTTTEPRPAGATSAAPSPIPTLAPGDPPPIEIAVAEQKPYTDKAVKVVGRLFSRMNATTTMACSATLVESPGRDLIWTAAHCVHGGAGGHYYSDVVFVPAYDSGSQAPYGTWPIKQMLVSSDWEREGGPAHSTGDYAALVAYTLGGRHIQDVVGTAAQIDFTEPHMSEVTAYGYPAVPPYNGTTLYRCQAPAGSMPADGTDLIWIGCTMTPGSSGGGWFVTIGGKPYLVSNFSMYSEDQRHLGPRLGPAARALYLEMASR